MINLIKAASDGKYNTKRNHFNSFDAQDREAYRADVAKLRYEFFIDAEAYAIQEGVPADYVKKLVDYAWDSVPSDGYREVAETIDDLVQIFNWFKSSSRK